MQLLDELNVALLLYQRRAAGHNGSIMEPEGVKENMQICHEDILNLLEVGRSAERRQNGEKARLGTGEVGDRARHAHEMLEIMSHGRYEAPNGTWVDVKEAVRKAVAGSVFFSESSWYASPLLKSPSLYRTDISVKQWTTLSAMQDLSAHLPDGCTIGVLNYASQKNPGGGFTNGAGGQEESLARSSVLYPCLTRFWEQFYRHDVGVFHHGIIVSPRVLVVRDDDGGLLDRPYPVHFVTAAAPNRDRAGVSERKATVALRERVSRVLDVLVRCEVTDVVLGAWGCGAFKNDPATVAFIFKEHLSGNFRGRFRSVVFAILGAGEAQVFANEFGIAVSDPLSEASKRGVVPHQRAAKTQCCAI